MDGDSVFKNGVPYDPLSSMRHFGWRYGFAITALDRDYVCEGLFSVLEAHFRGGGSAGRAALELPPAFRDADGRYNLNTFYNK